MRRRERPDVIKQSKEANIRERRKLERRIEGYGGINAQYQFESQQTENECALLRRELALAFVDESERRRSEAADRRRCYARTSRSLSRDTDPTLLLMKEREEARRRSNYKLFVRAKEKQVKATEKVKEFVVKLEEDAIKLKREQDPDLSDILLLVNGSVQESTEGDGETEDNMSSFDDSRPGSRAWREAMKARYVRTRVLRDFEIELTAQEIFTITPATTPMTSARR